MYQKFRSSEKFETIWNDWLGYFEWFWIGYRISFYKRFETETKRKEKIIICSTSGKPLGNVST